MAIAVDRRHDKARPGKNRKKQMMWTFHYIYKSRNRRKPKWKVKHRVFFKERDVQRCKREIEKKKGMSETKAEQEERREGDFSLCLCWLPSVSTNNTHKRTQCSTLILIVKHNK